MLVDIADLEPRLSFVMTDEDRREAMGALEDLSNDAQAIGSIAWVDELSTPDRVKNIILRAAARHMKNYEGYVQSRAGDEAVAWTDRGESAGTATFTSQEKRFVAQAAGKSPFIGSVSQVAWGTRDSAVPVGYVPSNTGLFPMYADAGPW